MKPAYAAQGCLATRLRLKCGFARSNCTTGRPCEGGGDTPQAGKVCISCRVREETAVVRRFSCGCPFRRHDKALAEALKLERNFGITGPENTVSVGGNAKMNEFQAAMGLCNLRHLTGELERRRAVCAAYRARLTGVPGLTLCPEREEDNYAYFPVVFDGYRYTRDEVAAALAAQGIFARKYFYPITTAFECYADRFDPDATPIARRVSERVLTLPLYADLALADVDHICDIVLA